MKKILCAIALLYATEASALHMLASIFGGVRHVAPVVGAAARLSGPSYSSGSYDDTGIRSRSLQPNPQPNQPQIKRSQSPQPQPRQLTVNRVREQAPPPPAPSAQVTPQPHVPGVASAQTGAQTNTTPAQAVKSHTPYWVAGTIIVAGGVYLAAKKFWHKKQKQSRPIAK